MYDPTVGRWATEDPIGFEAGDANLYRYVGNDPTDFTDPTGLIGYSDDKGGYHQIVRKPDPNLKYQEGVDIAALTKGMRLPSNDYLKSIGVDPTIADSAKFKDLVGKVINAMVDVPDPELQFTYQSKGQMQNDILYRAWVVVFAQQLERNRLGFPNGANDPVASFKDSTCWKPGDVTIKPAGKPEATVKGLVLKPGSTPADGIREFFKKGTGAIIDCASFVSVVSRRALLEVLGDDAYNKQYKDVPVGGLMVKGDPYPLQTVPDPFLTPGCEFTFQFPPNVNAGNYQQENTIFIPGGLYIGHPFRTPKSANDMLKAIEEASGKKGVRPGFTTVIPFTAFPKALR